MYQYTCQLKEGCKCISNINLFNCLIHLYSICYHVWLLKRVFIYPKESPPYKVTSLLVLIRLLREIIEYSWFVALSSSTHYCTLYRPHLLLPYFYYAWRWAGAWLIWWMCVLRFRSFCRNGCRAKSGPFAAWSFSVPGVLQNGCTARVPPHG